MQRLRTARFLASFVLAWFVACLGLAATASMAQPQGLEMVCSGGGIKLMPAGGGEEAMPRIGLDCPLCTPAVVPPPAPVAIALVLPSHAPAAVPAILPLPAAPLETPPARGPPAAA